MIKKQVKIDKAFELEPISKGVRRHNKLYSCRSCDRIYVVYDGPVECSCKKDNKLNNTGI